ncbi:MAG: YggT family protein [Legionellales bacterium]|jgi:YggT family protein
MSPLILAAMFLLDTAFTFLILAVLLRIILQLIRADFYNPMSQMVIKASNFLILPMRRIIPAYYGIDWASVVILIVLAFLKQGLLILLTTGIWVSNAGLMLLGMADIFDMVFYIYLFALIAIAVSSWLNPTAVNPLIQIASQLTAPLLNKIRQWAPIIGGFDISPLIFTVILVLFNILVIQVLSYQGVTLVERLSK